MNIFTNLIIEAANNSIPTTTPKPHKKQVPWWNEKCNTATHNAKHAFYSYKRHPTTENLINYKKHRALARKTLKESKRETWSNFITTMTCHTPIKIIWDKIKRIRGTNIPSTVTSLIDENNQQISHPMKMADLLAESFAFNSSDKNYNESFLKAKSSY